MVVAGERVGLIAAGVLFGVTAGRADEPPRPEAAGVPVREGQVQANGITIAYKSFGPEDREAILLIMGSYSRLTTWPVELCEELVKRGYRVIVLQPRRRPLDEARHRRTARLAGDHRGAVGGQAGTAAVHDP